MQYPFRKILCPVDFESGSVRELETAARIARDSDGTVFVLYVVPPVSMAAEPVVDVELYRQQNDAARAGLHDLAAQALHGIKHELLTHVGETSGAILATERRVGADLIVMVTHGRRGLSRLISGSIAQDVIQDAQCPVLTIRLPEHRHASAAAHSHH